MRRSGRSSVFLKNKDMETELFILEDYKKTGILSPADLEKIGTAALLLKEGKLVAFPTETVYGLGGDALLPEASKQIYAAKGRPSDNPLIVHISDLEQLEGLVEEISPEAALMAERFWPGPLTMVFRKNARVPKETTGGLDTVAVRFPVHPAARELIRRSGTVIAAPSANLSGRPSTTTAAHCIEDLTGRVAAIIDGGDCEIGLESTILDVSGDKPQLLRPGAVTLEMIGETLGVPVSEDAAILGPLAEGVKPKAPGMKYRHYAPKAPMILIAEKAEAGEAEAQKAGEPITGEPKTGGDSIARAVIAELKKAPAGTALLCSEECLAAVRREAPELLEHVILKSSGSRADRAGMAHVLFELLRELDAEGAEYIIAEGCPEDQIGEALMNRMKKAAAWQILYV